MRDHHTSSGAPVKLESGFRCVMCHAAGGMTERGGSVSCRFCGSIWPAGVDFPWATEPWLDGVTPVRDLEALRTFRLRRNHPRRW